MCLMFHHLHTPSVFGTTKQKNIGIAFEFVFVYLIDYGSLNLNVLDKKDVANNIKMYVAFYDFVLGKN